MEVPPTIREEESMVRFTPRLAAFAAVVLAANLTFAQGIRLFETDAPESQEGVGTPGATASQRSPTSNVTVVTVPLDNTGIGDWSFLNPRRPAEIPADAAVEFENQTADRSFEVTTTVVFKAGDFHQLTTLTVPLLIFEALMPATRAIGPRWTPEPGDEVLKAEELEAKLFPDVSQGRSAEIVASLEHVLTLEKLLRDRAKERKVEAAARKTLSELTPESSVKQFNDARDAVDASEKKREAIDKAIADFNGAATLQEDDDLPAKRKALIDELASYATDLREKRSAENARLRNKRPTREELALLSALTDKIAILDVAIDAVKTQSDDTILLAPIRLSLPGGVLDDCTVASGAGTCVATIRVYPNGRAKFPHRVLLLQPDGAAVAKFNVKFFQEEEAPARQVAYLISEIRTASIAPPKTSASLMAVASVGVGFDPFLTDRSATSRNCPFLCPDKPYDGERRVHYTGSGRVDVSQTFGSLFDGKVILAYKEGDLGGAATTTNIKLSQYRFNIYSVPGVTFHFGKFQFAAPSSGIAINETGEGFRLAFRNLAASHITKRESATNTADSGNRDNEVTILEAVNMPLPEFLRFRKTSTGKFENRDLPIRTFSLSYLTGKDSKGPEEKSHPNTALKETFFTEHDYSTYGGQVGFTIPRASVYGTFAAYRSRRSAAEVDGPCNQTLHVCDGEGSVRLLTITRPFAVDEDGKANRTFTLTWGTGSGDDPDTPNKDEGYIGETAGFAPDLIFLSTLSAGLSTRDFFDVKEFTDRKEEFMANDLGSLGIGRGLANKRYLGLKYVENKVSLLAWIATHMPYLKIPESDIRSKATIITASNYQLQEQLFGSRNAGRELDVEFNVETPRSVKVILKFGYYWPGAAVKPMISQNVWSAAGSISISL
jgi:hypothetical protein